MEIETFCNLDTLKCFHRIKRFIMTKIKGSRRHSSKITHFADRLRIVNAKSAKTTLALIITISLNSQ